MRFVEGDMVRSNVGVPKIGTFMLYVNSGANEGKWAMVCWFDVDPAQMRACSRRCNVTDLSATGERHPAYVLRDRFKTNKEDE